ncbi:MAG: hypothetical protein DRH17_10490 [Deltaproteobacteria bacterium]|nr:MAG: hypothetical protein DRH17_10490 [Deltaproteobacteria bacterium]
MAEKPSPSVKSSKIGRYVLLAALCIVFIGVGIWLILKKSEKPAKIPQLTSMAGAKKRMAVPSDKVIDYNKLKDRTDQALTALMEERKAPYGVEKSIDMIVMPDESIKVGKETIQMKNILDEVRLRQGEIVETDLTGESKSKGKEDAFGIHVVQPNENIWDIHFNLLKDYYDHKGIHLSPLADEPDRLGYSSGVGKILKFSENLVHIYNLRKRRLETDLHHIYPLSKIVIYNMGRVFALLDRIDYKDVNRIEFDGETLWLPAIQ